jgi:ketosteroid isomerase-like protein
MKRTYLILLSTLLFSCKPCEKQLQSEKQIINSVLDNWHEAAAAANFENYFNLMTDDAIFIGTDATENWNKTAFQAYAKPHFDKGKAWSFRAIERNIFFSPNGKTAWFDELLNTQMKICRGSGVLVKENGNWKIKHYVLSMTIPNDVSKQVIQIKSEIEDNILLKN